jgi:malonyl-CoA/methylmalonyl-CoA synthetase
MKSGPDSPGRPAPAPEGPLSDALVSAWPVDAPAIRSPDGSVLTHGDLDRASRRLAAQLCDAGVSPGDRVLFQVHKSPTVIVLHLALLRCGAIQVPVNPDYPASEVRHFLDDCGPVVVVRDPGCPDLPGPWTSLTLDAEGHGSLMELPPSGSALPVMSADDGAAILFTSGTTGRPKGALLTHGNLLANATTLIDAWGFSADDHLLHVLPLFHTHGLFVAVHCVLGSGASMTLLPRFEVDSALDAFGSESPCTVMMGVPTHYMRLLASPRLTTVALEPARLLISGSAPLSPTAHAEFLERTGQALLERYGMTETSMLTSNPLEGERRPGSVGLPLPGVDVRVTGAQPHNDVGVVEVRGRNVFAGYWGRGDLAPEIFTPDGWFRTGDLGRFDADGYLHLVGRSRDLVISGGLNIYPADVECVLDALPGVRESAVVGVADADLGERLVAAVTLDAGSRLDGTRVRELARERLAGYQVPKDVVIVTELPRNVMGKVEKAVLRERLRGSQ